MNKSVTICINACERKPGLNLLLNTLMFQTMVDFDLVVVDDSAKADLSNVVSSARGRFEKMGVELSYVKNGQRLGLAKSRNVGMDRMDTPVGIFLDDDHVCDSRFVEYLMEVFEKRHNVGCVGALFPHLKNRKMLAKQIPRIFGDIKYDAEWSNRQRYCYKFDPDDDGIRPALVLGGIVAFKIDDSIRKNENLSFVSHREDTLFSLRYLQAGYNNFVATRSLAYHRVDPTGGCRTFGDDADKQRAADDAIYNRLMGSELRSAMLVARARCKG